MSKVRTNRLIFVRHAESLANVVGSLDCDVPGPALSPYGFEQAKSLVDVLVEDLDNRPVRAVWASSMLRAQQTAEPIAERWGLPLRVHPLLREGHVGDLRGRIDDEAHQALEDLFAVWLLDGDLNHRRPGGDTGQDLVERMRQVLDEVLASLLDPPDGAPGDGGDLAEPGAVVVVSHGAMLRVTLPRLCDGFTPAYTLTHHLPNIGRVVVDLLDRDGPVLACRTWSGATPG